MPEMPNVNCKRLTLEEVQKIEGPAKDRLSRALELLIVEGKMTAWLFPDGIVRYQQVPEKIEGLTLDNFNIKRGNK